MKVSKEVGARHRAALLEAAGRLLRERGFDKVGVAEIARAAGLTHGAFYSHFASKEAICREAVETMAPRLSPQAARGDRQAFIESYLDPRHVRERGLGCPYAALAGDVPRESASVRTTFAQALARWIDRLAFGRKGKAAREEALVSAALMVGALALARAAEPAVGGEILQAARRALLR